MRKLALAFLLAIISLPVATRAATALEIRSVSVTDMLRISRKSFSSSERITLSCQVYTPVAVGYIGFTFSIYDPSNKLVFKHTGNSVPGGVGLGGSDVSNIAISRFYSSPGNYSLEVTATANTGTSASQKIVFAVYSPNIILTYPANGAKDLIDQPLVLRWVGSGASKYRIYVDDDQSFYNTILKAETVDTSFTYPQNPSDTRQKLVGGQVYYWKVEGLDGLGNKMASSQVPFSFSVAKEGVSATRDLAIAAITILENSQPPDLSVKVILENTGGRPETNITVTIYLSGMVYGTQKVDLINSGEKKSIVFTFQPQDLVPGKPLFLSATHDLYDNNLQNNFLTVAINLKESYFKSSLAKVLGRVTASVKGKVVSIEGARIEFSGPQAGEVKSGSGGQYKIEDLAPGSYDLEVTHPEYSSKKKSIVLEKAKAYTNVDFELEKKEYPEYSLEDMWDIVKERLSDAVLEDLKYYKLSEVTGMEGKELYDIMTQIKDGKAKIDEAALTK